MTLQIVIFTRAEDYYYSDFLNITAFDKEMNKFMVTKEVFILFQKQPRKIVDTGI